MLSEDEQPASTSPPLPVSSVTAVPSSGSKRRPRHQRSSPQPDSGTSEQLACVSLVNSGTDFCEKDSVCFAPHEPEIIATGTVHFESINSNSVTISCDSANSEMANHKAVHPESVNPELTQRLLTPCLSLLSELIQPTIWTLCYCSLNGSLS